MKHPEPIFETVYAFPPSRDTLGGTAYLILKNSGNLLIDCPTWQPETAAWLADQGGVAQLVLTNRVAHGQVRAMQAALDCQVIVQEQEAYLLPAVPQVQPFAQTVDLAADVQVLWTPGFSPGSACVLYRAYGGVLFSGRHVLPDRQGHPMPLRLAKTFHWGRQLQQVQRLVDQFSPETLAWICPGANTGFLRGDRRIASAYDQLAAIDFTALHQAQPLM